MSNEPFNCIHCRRPVARVEKRTVKASRKGAKDYEVQCIVPLVNVRDCLQCRLNFTPRRAA